jgi:hypothetical protein
VGDILVSEKIPLRICLTEVPWQIDCGVELGVLLGLLCVDRVGDKLLSKARTWLMSHVLLFLWPWVLVGALALRMDSMCGARTYPLHISWHILFSGSLTLKPLASS